MMKRLLFALLFMGVSSVLYAQAPTEKKLGWTANGTFAVNFTQVGLSNWAGGGQNTIGINGLLNYQANLTTEISKWENSFDFGYGLTKVGSLGFRKSDDRIIIISKYGYQINEQWSYAALLDFRTQFTAGNKYATNSDSVESLISNFLAPANAQVGIGFTYKPTDYLTITLAPLANRLLIITDPELRDRPATPGSTTGFLGNEVGKSIRSDLGTHLNITFKKDLMTNVTLESKLVSFAPYSQFTRQFVNWNSLLTLKVNEYINANFALDVVYDPNLSITRENGTVGPSAQIRNIIGIGFGYKL